MCCRRAVLGRPISRRVSQPYRGVLAVGGTGTAENLRGERGPVRSNIKALSEIYTAKERKKCDTVIEERGGLVLEMAARLERGGASIGDSVVRVGLPVRDQIFKGSDVSSDAFLEFLFLLMR